MTQKIFDYDAKGILAKADITGKKKPGSEVYGRLFVLGPKAKKKDVIDQLKSEALAWHLKRAKRKRPSRGFLLIRVLFGSFNQNSKQILNMLGF